jgi:hypothetical protein
MSHPWIPPYLGTYEDLIAALLHNPFLGSGSEPGNSRPHQIAEPNPMPWRTAEPSPSPWFAAVSYLMTSISLKEIAAGLPEGEARSSLNKHADHAISSFLDDICGTPPRRIPWPWPGPPPWIFPLASQLVIAAHSFEAGNLREETLRVAGQIAQKGFVAGQR